MDRLLDQLAAGKLTDLPPRGIRNAADSHKVGFDDLVLFREFFQFKSFEKNFLLEGFLGGAEEAEAAVFAVRSFDDFLA